MKMIKEGVLPNKTCKGTCSNCHCQVEFQFDEVGVVKEHCSGDMREPYSYDIYKIKCPTRGCTYMIGGFLPPMRGGN